MALLLLFFLGGGGGDLGGGFFFCKFLVFISFIFGWGGGRVFLRD